MKNVGWLSCGICLMIYLVGCTHNGVVKEEFYRGFYHGANQIKEAQAQDDPPVGVHIPLSYEAYQHERQKMLSDHKDK